MRERFEQTAIRLGESVEEVEQSVSRLLQQQRQQTEAINAQLNNWQDTLTGGREMLEQMNTSVASVHQLIETTEALSGQLTTSATQLESAGRQLTQASNAFNQENERYLTANRETTEQIQAAVGHLNNSVQRFQTIDNGLQGIFAEIERGLNEYVTTTRESINTYLTEFSSQLTQASTALAGSVEALGENVEILIERRPRR
jgi:predicted  nucleic acid-binding Zn-ribbon protein